ncbi:hypothetical protein TRAPUB_7114 [Trametes pubescens]|uniref:Uncharacterized protein n=1 Tax=Trametes pubescens TaxID=154538 RepID=A0A1M2W6S9_TRAPU|nr:hypothetical protein TRAPUB_7114 [Trametes pubescens]
MKSGISGSAPSWHVCAMNQDGQYEDVTRVLASDTYVSPRFGHPAMSSSYRHSTDSGTQPQSSERSDSRIRSSGASMTAEPYQSCESRYWISASASASSSLLLASESPTPGSPPSPISVLLLTPEQGVCGYAGLADAVPPRVVVDGGEPLDTVMESEGEDIDIDSQSRRRSRRRFCGSRRCRSGREGWAWRSRALGPLLLAGGRVC